MQMMLRANEVGLTLLPYPGRGFLLGLRFQRHSFKTETGVQSTAWNLRGVCESRGVRSVVGQLESVPGIWDTSPRGPECQVRDLTDPSCARLGPQGVSKQGPRGFSLG